jgi:hypothetical protein
VVSERDVEESVTERASSAGPVESDYRAADTNRSMVVGEEPVADVRDERDKEQLPEPGVGQNPSSFERDFN